ncbi:MAG TPA: NADH-quinone oxidoreductase subunit N [Dissulfurispiraceae bacterium]|nr:NADH-quinone oxidoreductase subunit N [Dissulfurispiraceae bacterium]
MNMNDFQALSPLIIMAASPMAAMLAIAVSRSYRFTATLSLYSIYAALLSLAVAYPQAPHQVSSLIIIDRFAILYMAIILISGAVVIMLSYGYIKKCDINYEEYHILMLLAIMGSMVLVCSSHFASLFLGLEILSVSLYALVAYPKQRIGQIEAALKYLVLAAVSSAFLLFGMALVYADSGTMALSAIESRAAHGTAYTLPFAAGLSLITVGIGFKLALVPFHMWAPDVYDGAPAPVSAFIATVSKGAVFAILLRYFNQSDLSHSSLFFLIFAVIAAASMIIGNILALFQKNIKRVLAYSSISHMGYLLVAFLAGGELSVRIATFYLIAYFIAIFGAFGIISFLSSEDKEADDIDYYRGLSSKRPFLTLVLAAMLFSLAGIPLTAGFIGKFYLITAGVSTGLWKLVVTLALSSTIGLFYYLRIIFNLFAPAENLHLPINVSAAGSVLLITLLLLLLWIGVYPEPLMDGISAILEASF